VCREGEQDGGQHEGPGHEPDHSPRPGIPARTSDPNGAIRAP
jgi:hypothetical protein